MALEDDSGPADEEEEEEGREHGGTIHGGKEGSATAEDGCMDANFPPEGSDHEEDAGKDHGDDECFEMAGGTDEPAGDEAKDGAKDGKEEGAGPLGADTYIDIGKFTL
jgi:hypothetical protein